MNAKELKTAKVFTDYDGVTHKVAYSSDEQLMTAIYDLLDENYPELDTQDDTRITLPDGSKFMWEPTIAHYCFAEGCISEDEAFKMMLNLNEKGN